MHDQPRPDQKIKIKIKKKNKQRKNNYIISKYIYIPGLKLDKYRRIVFLKKSDKIWIIQKIEYYSNFIRFFSPNKRGVIFRYRIFYV